MDCSGLNRLLTGLMRSDLICLEMDWLANVLEMTSSGLECCWSWSGTGLD